ncbi:hypothetical protein U1Q18_027890, partial [Sarracenia purpurea var. burkii]
LKFCIYDLPALAKAEESKPRVSEDEASWRRVKSPSPVADHDIAVQHYCRNSCALILSERRHTHSPTIATSDTKQDHGTPGAPLEPSHAITKPDDQHCEHNRQAHCLVR